MRVLRAREPVLELYGMRVVQPPDTVPRAPASHVFRHMEGRGAGAGAASAR